MIVLVVALAGGVGAAARFVVDGVLRRRVPLLPTLVVNVTGSFGLGLLVGALLHRPGAGPLLAVLGTGFLGGYTTFSAASTETARLLVERRYATAAAVSVGMLLASVGACGAGLTLGRLW